MGMAAEDPSQGLTRRHRIDNGAPCLVLSTDLAIRRPDHSQSPTVERLAPVHMVEKSILLPIDPLFRHPARRQQN